MSIRLFSITLTLAFGIQCSAFDFRDVCHRAESLGAGSYVPYTNSVPKSLARMTYEQHQAIRFRPERAVWKAESLPFRIEFFHPGYLHNETVAIREIAGGTTRLLPAGPQFYDYGSVPVVLPPDLGHAGFRILHPGDEFGEVAAFLGASYFRMLGKGQAYGASSRGLAIGTGSPEGEEFPVFREFWLKKPDLRDNDMRVYALMDSPSVAGAYQFTITPGADTVAAVECILYPRTNLVKFGLAPLTSMFLHGKNGRPQFTDFRPEVHDSDGLLLHTGAGAWIWHPLEAGRMLRINAFSDENPRGFGLLQRERSYENYEDPVAHFERRPTVWVVPRGAWGKGAVELVQIPSNREFNDNVVAFWVPAEPLHSRIPLKLAYDLHWTTETHLTPELGYVRSTRIGRVFVEPHKEPPNLRFVVDFGGAAVQSLSIGDSLEADIQYGKNVKFVADSLYRNEADQTWRLVIEIADPGQAIDLKAFLKYHDAAITETWTYTWQP